MPSSDVEPNLFFNARSAVALKLEDGVNDVFHDLRSSKGAVLSDMAYEEHRGTSLLSIVLELGGGLAQLTHTAGWRLYSLCRDSLYGIHY